MSRTTPLTPIVLNGLTLDQYIDRYRIRCQYCQEPIWDTWTEAKLLAGEPGRSKYGHVDCVRKYGLDYEEFEQRQALKSEKQRG